MRLRSGRTSINALLLKGSSNCMRQWFRAGAESQDCHVKGKSPDCILHLTCAQRLGNSQHQKLFNALRQLLECWLCLLTLTTLSHLKVCLGQVTGLWSCQFYGIIASPHKIFTDAFLFGQHCHIRLPDGQDCCSQKDLTWLQNIS